MAGPAFEPPVQVLIVDTTAAVPDQRREPVLQRLVRATVDRGAVVAVDVGEAAVEGRQQPPALTVRDGHRPPHGRVRRLVAAGVEGERRPLVVEPRDVGDDPRVLALRAKRGHQDRRASADQGAGPLPGPFARQRVGEDRRDRGRPGRRLNVRLRARETHRRQALQLRTALRRRVQAVVDALDLVDQPVAVMASEPFDAAHAERQARRLHHRRGVRVDDGDEEDEHDQEREPPSPPPAPLRRRLPPFLPPSGKHRRRGGSVVGGGRRSGATAG
jgi:hypothetical protein